MDIFHKLRRIDFSIYDSVRKYVKKIFDEFNNEYRKCFSDYQMTGHRFTREELGTLFNDPKSKIR